MLKIHVVVRIAICFCFVFLPLQPMDEWFYDRFFRLRGRHENPTPFILVHVNKANLSQEIGLEKSVSPDIERYGRRADTRWHDQYYRALLERIEKDQPKLVIFTSFFDAVDSGTGGSLPFNNLLFSAFLNDESKLIPPPASLVKDENYGFSNIFPDQDNVVRRTHLVYSSGPSLALRTYHRLLNEPVKRNLLDSLYIDFRGPQGSYPTFEAKDIMEENPPEGTFKGKIVLIGRDGSHYWEYETPLGRMTKMEIQANIMDTFLSHREIRIFPRHITLALAAAAVILSVAIILYMPLTMAWLFLLLEAIFIVLSALFAFSFLKVWAGIANPIFCIFVTHLLMLGYKLTKQEEEQWKIRQEAEYLKEMDQFKNNFISLFSHDLKTPIAKIRAIIGRLLTEHPELSHEVKNDLKGIDRTNNELARFISDILKVTKMESMRLEPAKEVLDLNRLAEESVQRLKFLADEKNITLLLDLEPLFSMEGDPQLIQEVITNLIENAIKYSPPSRRVIVRTLEEDGKVRVEVVDEGEGIPPDELPRVTGKFYRGKGASQKTKGSGLGLYLSKYFVELHQGFLEIESELGKGTKVSFWLPLSA